MTERETEVHCRLVIQPESRATKGSFIGSERGGGKRVGVWRSGTKQCREIYGPRGDPACP